MLIIFIWFGKLCTNSLAISILACISEEFQTITIAKLTDKANRKCESGILMAIVVTQGVWLHNYYRVIKQKPIYSLESYLCKTICKGHWWVMAALEGVASHYMLRLGDTRPHATSGPTIFAK